MLLALDSNVIIAALSGDEPDSPAAQHIIQAAQSGRVSVVLSAIVWGEVLGLRQNKTSASEQLVKDFFLAFEQARFIDVTPAIAQMAGSLRVSRGTKLRLPDAIHLATALHAQADNFITSDAVLLKIAQSITSSQSPISVKF